MKKILLGTTAFLAASVAMAAEAPTAKVSGVLSANLTARSMTDDATRSNQSDLDSGWTLNQEGWDNELIFSAKGKSDAGLGYSARVAHRIIATRTKEASVEFSDSWGKLELGQNDSPAGDNYLGGSAVLSGRYGWDGYSALGAAFNSNAPDGAADSSITADATKVIYYLPSIAGVDVGVSLTPGGGTAGYRNAAEGSLQYSADLGGAKITVGGTFSQAKYNLTTNTNATPGQQEADFHNYRTFNYGAKVVVGALSVAAGYNDHGKGGIAKNTRGLATGAIKHQGTLSSVGVGYDLGGGTSAGVGYAVSKQAIIAGPTHKGSRSANFWTVGVTSAVAPGLSVFGEYNNVSGNNGKIVNGGFRGNEVIVGTTISF